MHSLKQFSDRSAYTNLIERITWLEAHVTAFSLLLPFFGTLHSGVKAIQREEATTGLGLQILMQLARCVNEQYIVALADYIPRRPPPPDGESAAAVDDLSDVPRPLQKLLDTLRKAMQQLATRWPGLIGLLGCTTLPAGREKLSAMGVVTDSEAKNTKSAVAYSWPKSPAAGSKVLPDPNTGAMFVPLASALLDPACFYSEDAVWFLPARVTDELQKWPAQLPQLLVRSPRFSSFWYAQTTSIFFIFELLILYEVTVLLH